MTLQFSDKDRRASEWFDQLWDSLPADSSTTLDNYEQNWRPPPPAPRVSPARSGRAVRDIYALGRGLTDWASFATAISDADRYWGTRWKRSQPVIGEVESWLNTITLGRAVVRRDDWSELTPEDHYLILGRGEYGYLGSMGFAGVANNVFAEATPQNLAIRTTIRAALDPVLAADDAHFADAAGGFIAVVNGIPGIGGGIATRLLALARPDRAISVNNASRSRLAQLTALPPSSLSSAPHGRARSYTDLLRWFEDRNWYSNPQPSDAYERLLAGARAALFDAFVYEPRK